MAAMTNNPTPTLRPDAVLVVIDMQKGFEDPYWGRRDNPDAEKNVALLVEAWQRTGRPIVLVGHDSVTPASPLHPSRPGNAFKDELAGVRPDLTVRKSVNSAFYGTPDLHAWLQERGARQLVVVGIQTNMCNETTARMAGNLGYEVLFAVDAMHTFDLAGPDGQVVTAEELTRAAVTNLHGGRFAMVVSTAQVLAAA
jgi:nicotinamidase-related amidase